MTEQLDEALEEVAAALNSVIVEADITVRSMAKREVDVRLAPFDIIIDTISGPEVIAPGAFRDTPADGVLLMGLEHEVHLGIGQDGKVKPTRRPIGRSISIEERNDGGYGTFRVAKTSAGDEFLALADDGVIRGVSVEMGRDMETRERSPQRPQDERRDARRCPWTVAHLSPRLCERTSAGDAGRSGGARSGNRERSRNRGTRGVGNAQD